VSRDVVTSAVSMARGKLRVLKVPVGLYGTS
jgi:hypothetical protein